MGTLESFLPEDITRQALTLGKELASPRAELAFPYAQTLQAMVIATEHEIAISGLEAFEVNNEGLLTVCLADHLPTSVSLEIGRLPALRRLFRAMPVQSQLHPT
jgi:hypothetical protein